MNQPVAGTRAQNLVETLRRPGRAKPRALEGLVGANERCNA